MKNQKGVTLVALVIYVVVFSIVMAILAVITNFFHTNVIYVQDQANYAPEFNKFNMFFIEDVKTNREATVVGNTIEFGDGTSYYFSLEQKAIYRDGKRIAKDVQAVTFKTSTETVRNTTKNIINVNISIGNENDLFNKSIDYTLRYW
jgi:hypothetical protein